MNINSTLTGDALTVLKTFPDASVDCCVTSPPYYGLRDYGVSGQIGLEETPDLYIERLTAVFMEVYRILKPSGSLWLNIGDSYWGGKGYSGSSAGIYQYERRKEGKCITNGYSSVGGKGTIRPTDRKHAYIKPKDLIGIPWMLALKLRDAGWYLRQDIIWHKPNPMPESVTDRCTKSHEYIFLMTKSSRYYFDYDSLREPYTKPLNRWSGSSLKASGHSRWSEATGQNIYRDRNMRPCAAGPRRRDVWSVNVRPYQDAHFATFSPELIVPCIKAGCPENGIVLDPFMGAGTTAVVARKLERNFIGIELNPDYIKIIKKRLRKELGIFE
jgi:DNA modification methylase